MEKSFLHFKATHPDWQPSDPASSLFLDRLRDQMAGASGGGGREVDDMGRKERSRSYDRAWAKSSHLLWKERKLATMRESSELKEEKDDDEDVEEGEEEEDDGWHRRVNGEDEGQAQGEGDEGFLKDVGMAGLLQHVLHR